MRNYQFIKIIFLSLFVLFSMQTFAAGKNTLPDSVITGKVKSKIMLDPSISVFKVDVSTNDAVVSLNGDVNSDTDASALIELAQATDGVKDVDAAKLSVKNSKQPFTDISITAKIKGTYIREKLFGKNVPVSNITVETNNGIVYLSGLVDTQQQANNAISLAKSVSGVSQVESRIKVNSNG